MLNRKDVISQARQTTTSPVIITELQLLDSNRNREIPALIYSKADISTMRSCDLVIFSPGWGVGVDYKSYAYLTENLAMKGFLVISIQHNLPVDISGPTPDEFTVTKSPNWETGVANIKYLLESIPALYPRLKTKSITLIGHSNGGDVSMLYASRYPKKLSKVISLDNRRIPLPLEKRPTICSIRASAEKVHEDLLPSQDAIKKYKMRIIYLKGVKHNEMDQNGTPEQHEQILKALDACMSSRWKNTSKNDSNLTVDDL